MKKYEALYIVRPDASEEEVQAVAKDVETLMVNQGGVIERCELWGKRRLAYEVQKSSEGYYVLLRFDAAPAFISRLENHFRLTDAIIRYLVVHFDEKTLRLEARQKKRKEAEIRSSTAVAASRDDDDDDKAGSRRSSRRFADDDDDDDDRRKRDDEDE